MKNAPRGEALANRADKQCHLTTLPAPRKIIKRTAWNYTLKDDPRRFVIFCPVACSYQEALRSIKFRFSKNVASVDGGDS